jgi:putative sigma-54 modulation protein
MDIRIQSIHFEVSKQLQEFTQKKVNKLEKLCDDITTAEVSFKVIKPETVDNKEAGIKLFVPGETLYARKVCNTFEQAVDDTLEALEKQILKYKEKQQNK